MSSINKTISILKALKEDLKTNIPNFVTDAVVTLKTKVQDRVQGDGLNSKGSTLGRYSTKKIPAFFFIGKGRGSTDTALRKLSKEKKLISYSDFRKLDGKQNKHVDLTFTGNLWKDIGIAKKSTSNGKSKVTVEPITQRSKEVAGYNEKRYGNFLKPSVQELKDAEEDMQYEIERLIKIRLNAI